MTIGDFDDRQASPDSSGSGLFPCTLLQERLWTQLRTDGPAGLNIAMRWLVNGSLSQAAAEGALQSLVQRHEILRTAFREVDGKLAQVVLPECPLKLQDIDLSFLPADESAARAEEIARAEALELIDPGQAPLMRTTLLRLAPDRAVLLLTFHAMVADGWSTGLIAREFRAAAHAIGSGAAPDTSEPELQFVDYALWQQALLASGALDEAQSFWQRQLQNAVGTEVPPDRLPTAPKGEPSHITSVLLPDDLSRVIEGFARQHNVTLYTMAVAGLALMLHRVTGDAEIVVGSQVANREEPTAEELVGPTVNAITLRLRVDDNVGVRAFVGTVADTVHEALRHQRLPFEIAGKFAPDHDGKPLHAINLVVHRSYSGTVETEAKDAGRFSLVSLPSYSSGTLWPLNFFMIGRDEGWRLSCEADAALYAPATVQGLVEAWRHCLETLSTGTDGRLADDDTAPAVDNHGSIPLRDPARHVVRFHEGGAQTPVTVLNNRSVYYQLARMLGEERPFIDLMLYPQDGPFDWGAYTFEDFGTYTRRLIQWAQPRGPYILGGHCVFGVLAFEAARQLQRMGEKVSLVALFDSWGPGYRETMSGWDRMLRRQQLRLHRYGERLKKFRRGEATLDDLVRKPILFHTGLLPPEPGPQRQALAGEWFDDYLYDAVTRYRPSPYDGDVILFRSNEPLRGRLFDERMGWGPVVSGNLKKVDVNSGHFDMFRERPAGEIAAVLRTR